MASETVIRQRCLRCWSEVTPRIATVECEACGACWPVIDGVPAYASAKYFGEVSREAMRRLLAAAREGHWREAVKVHFGTSDPDQHHYIADLNRAAWIPLLPLGPGST